MKYIYSFLTAALLCSFCQAQDEYKPASKESEAYHRYRMYTTTPPYGINKVRASLKQAKSVQQGDDEYYITALPAKLYNSLSLREQFTYHMIHGESYTQNCDIDAIIQDEQKKIFAQLPGAIFGEDHWSDRQYKWMKDNRDSVMALIRESVGRTKRVGLNYKLALVQINATEMIPFLIDTYKLEKKDHDILTVLMLLMLANKYATFMSSASYHKLYQNEESSYRAFLVFSAANEELILQRATDLYNGLSK